MPFELKADVDQDYLTQIGLLDGADVRPTSYHLGFTGRDDDIFTEGEEEDVQ